MSAVLGIHGGVTSNQHEASACLIVDGRVVALCEEERYTRIKGSYGVLPARAVRECLRIGGITINDVDLVVTPGCTYDFFNERISDWLQHHFGHAPRVESVHHQMAHCAAAFYGSGYDDATVVSLDASGDAAAGFICHGTKDGLKLVKRVPTANSLGYFYTLMTHYLGFEDGDEYKVMGLAPYGARGRELDLAAILELRPGGWLFHNDFLRSDPSPKSPFEPMYDREKMRLVIGRPNRVPSDPLDAFWKDVAWAVQDRFEAAYLNFMEGVKSETGSANIAIAGGCSLNCAANRKLVYQGEFRNAYISPVASDRGLALGCAYLGAVSCGDKPGPLKLPYLGTEYTNDQIRSELEANGISYSIVFNPHEAAARLLDEGRIIGWFQGRSEAGARALGNRSILAQAHDKKHRDAVNARIKYRESFRPFAPAIALEAAETYFRTDGREYPTMSATVDVLKPWQAQAVTHVDGTARLQTVTEKDNPLFHALLTSYGQYSGAPMVLNTSFNLKGQPIVETPRDALMTFFGCGLDDLIIGDFHVSKRGEVELKAEELAREFLAEDVAA